MSFKDILRANVPETQSIMDAPGVFHFTLQLVTAGGAVVGRPIRMSVTTLDEVIEALCPDADGSETVHYWDDDFEEFVLPGSMEVRPAPHHVMLCAQSCVAWG